ALGREQPALRLRLVADLGQNRLPSSSVAVSRRPSGDDKRLHTGAGLRALFANTLSSAARRPTASAPVSTAASPRLDTSTRGGYGSHSGSSERTGARRRSPFAPRPPPSTASSTSATAATAPMCNAIRRASSST